MKLRHRFQLVVAASILSAALPRIVEAAETSSTATAAGYWEGGIAVPQQELAIAVELIPAIGSAWQGTINIPMQGMRGFKLDSVKVEAADVHFQLPGIPGEPTFDGKLAEDGKSIAGNFSQGGGTVPFHLERKTKPVPTADEVMPVNGVAGKGLPGTWRGAINPLPNIELRLALELTADAAGKVQGVLVSLDQGKARIPISTLTEQEGKVHLETPSVHGEFNGTLNADGSELAGDWIQNGRSTPLVFKRLPATAAP